MIRQLCKCCTMKNDERISTKNDERIFKKKSEEDAYVTGSPFSAQNVDPSAVVLSDAPTNSQGRRELPLNAQAQLSVDATKGNHKKQVYYADKEIASHKVKVQNISTGFRGTPVHFTVDASAAGIGNLEVAVNNGETPSMAKSLGEHVYDISFTPKSTKDHVIGIRFKDHAVPGSPFICRIFESENLKLRGQERTPVGEPAKFLVELSDPGTKVNVTVTGPNGRELDASVKYVDKKSYEVQYTPKIVGVHTIDVRCNGASQTLTSKVFDATAVKVYNIKDGVLGQVNTFYIDVASAGAGNMEIVVSVNGVNVVNYVKAMQKSTFEVHFTPEVPDTHLIHVRFNDQFVPGSPFSARVVDPSAAKLSQGRHEPPRNAQAQHTTATGGEGSSQPRPSTHVMPDLKDPSREDTATPPYSSIFNNPPPYNPDISDPKSSLAN